METGFAGSATTADKTIKVAVNLTRWFFGAWFMFFGINYFVEFIPQPMGHGPVTYQFLQVLIDTKLFGIAKVIEFIVGFLIFIDRATALALIIVFPITCIIGWVNWHMEQWSPNGEIIAVVFTAMNIFLLWAYRGYYWPMLAWRVKITPGTSLFK